jgi:hypothetical protein
MGFIQSCFIRKNSPELRKKLEELGYTNAPRGRGVWFIPIEELMYLVTYPESGHYQGCNGYWYEDDFDCGTNEELFLALAALRDDTNENQWFIAQRTMWDENYNGEITVYYEENEWIMWNDYSFMEDMPSDFRKATVEEIITHFNNQ